MLIFNSCINSLPPCGHHVSLNHIAWHDLSEELYQPAKYHQKEDGSFEVVDVTDADKVSIQKPQVLAVSETTHTYQQ